MQVRRAWPRAGGGITFEAIDIEDRVRAGSISASGKISVTPYGTDPALPGLAEVAAQGELLVHRYKRRAVVRLRPQDGPERYVKLLARGRTEHVAAVSEVMQRAAARAGFDAPRVEDVGQGRIVFSAVPGRSLHQLGEELAASGRSGASGSGTTPGQWEEAWQRWASQWPALVRAAAPDSSEADILVIHDGAAEAATLTDWVDHLVEHRALKFSKHAVHAVTGDIVEELTREADHSLGLSHRDLHDKQILLDPATFRLGLVDFDTASFAEPALDLANLAVHLQLRVAQGILPPAQAASARSAIDNVLRTLDVPPARFEAYEHSTRLRLVCVYAFRPAWRQLAQEWLDGIL